MCGRLINRKAMKCLFAVLFIFIACGSVSNILLLWMIQTRGTGVSLRSESRNRSAIYLAANSCLQLSHCNHSCLRRRPVIRRQALYVFSKMNGPGCLLQEFGKNCELFKAFLHYPSTPLSDEEKHFPLAYSIRMHKDPVQVEMLLRAIYSPQNIYCIYIDKKSPPEVRQTMEAVSECFDNVFLTNALKPFYYATASQMDADLQCMRELLDKRRDWKYYLNLSGQEFPLKTNREIVRILSFLNGTNDLEIGEFHRSLRWRILNHVVPDENTLFRFAGKKLDKLGVNITLFKGSAYGAFSRTFVQFLLEDQRVQKLRHWLSDTFAPEETLFATANALPGAPGGYAIHVDQNAEIGEHISRVVLWKWTRVPKCHGKHVRAVCMLTCSDLTWLRDRPQLFANKFDINYDVDIIRCLLNNVIKRRNDSPLLNLTYYYNLPHVKHKSGIF